MTRHRRHYTLEQATAAMPFVRRQLERIRAGRAGLTDEQARAALDEARPANGGGSPGKVVGEGFVELQRGLASLQEAGILVRDIDRGLIDFPAFLSGQEVYLCWLEDEDEIAWWHPLDSGIAGRRPLQ